MEIGSKIMLKGYFWSIHASWSFVAILGIGISLPGIVGYGCIPGDEHRPRQCEGKGAKQKRWI